MSIKSAWKALMARMRGDQFPYRVPRFAPGVVNAANMIAMPSEDGRDHLLVVGTTGRGRSGRLMAEAKQRGISYEELLKQLEPSDDAKLAARERAQTRAQHELIRLNAVRQAYWTQTDPDDSDLWSLHDALQQIGNIEFPTREQQRILFFMLPADVIGNGIAWGFDDTEVRGAIWEFVRENVVAIAVAVAELDDKYKTREYLIDITLSFSRLMLNPATKQAGIEALGRLPNDATFEMFVAVWKTQFQKAGDVSEFDMQQLRLIFQSLQDQKVFAHGSSAGRTE